MNRSMRNAALLGLLLAASGCSSVKDAGNSVGGWFGSGDGALSTAAAKTPANSTGPLLKYAATLRINKYVDQRKLDNPRQLGISTQRIRGMDQGPLLLDQELANIVTAAVKKHFDSEGYQVLEGAGADKAIFEVSGVIKELALNVKYRDEITIGIETTLKDVRTGAVVWSGMVTEKNDRFAGVSGNSKEDVVDYLNQELRVVTGKTVDAISASLMATQPELFNLTPGTKPIAGVTVYVAPTVAKPAAPVAPAAPAVMMPNAAVQSAAPVPPPAYVPHASATSGLLLVNTSPARAKVYLDGVYYGMSPLRLEMEPGVHAISVKLEGYKMVTEKVSVRKGDNTEMELMLER